MLHILLLTDKYDAIEQLPITDREPQGEADTCRVTDAVQGRVKAADVVAEPCGGIPWATKKTIINHFELLF